MDDKRINIAVVLSAYDKMSAVLNATVTKSIRSLTTLQQKSKAISEASFAAGRQNMASGAAIAAPFALAVKAYADQEEAALDLKTSMMTEGSRIDNKSYQSLVDFAKKSTDVYGQTTTSYLEMNRVLLENGLKASDILNGIGDSVEKLGFVFKMAPSGIAQFAARMKQDMGIIPQEMNGMMDLISRLQRTGIGKNGEEAVTELSEFYSKAGIGARLLGATGLQAAKDLGALGGVFIRTGLSGNTVGNNFRRIFDGIRDADKIKKANAIAAQYGIHLDFFDKDHKFKGIAAFAGELGKLEGMDPTKINAILKPFGGHQGLSTDFLESLGKYGVKAFNDYNSALASKATMDAIAAEKQRGLNFQITKLINQTINAAVVFGSTYGPAIKRAIMDMGALLKKIITFVDHHRGLVGTLSKGILYFAAYRLAVGSGLMVWGSLTGLLANSIKFLGFTSNALLIVGRGALVTGAYMGRLFMLFLTRGIPAMISFTAQVWANAAAWLANPATYIILAIVAAIAALIAIGIVIYNNWDKILTWFHKKWVLLKAAVSGMIGVMKLFLDVVVGVGKALLGAFTFNPKLMVEGAKQAATAVNSIANGGISKAFAEGVNSSLKGSNARVTKDGDVILNTDKIKPKTNTTNQIHHTTINVHFNGVKPDDHQTTASHLTSVMDKWYKYKKANEQRTSYQH